VIFVDSIILDDINKNIYGSEEDSMRWFDEFLKSSKGTFATSVELFQKYYDKCVDDLVHLNLDVDSRRVEYDFLGDSPEEDVHYKCNYMNQQDIDNCISNSYHLNIIETLRHNSYLRDSVERLGLIDKNAMSKIMSLSDDDVRTLTTEKLYFLFHSEVSYHDKPTDEEVNQMVFSLLKVHRLNNLQIKYAHTARVVYLTNLELSEMNIDSDLMRSMALTSALFHDVGRFYQGSFYNSYDDGAMRAIEGSGKGHAEAGYYYSLLDMISLNTLGVNTSEDLIIHAIAALVVQRHQTSNALNKDFDMVQKDIQFSDGIDTKLLNFVLDAYIHAEPFKDGIHARFGNMIPHQQQYMNDAMNQILRTIRLVAEQYSSDSRDIDSVMQAIGEFLGDNLGGYLKNPPITKEGFYSLDEITILEKVLGEHLNEYRDSNGNIAVCDFLSQKIADYRMCENSSSIFFLTEEEMSILKSVMIPKELEEKLLIKKFPRYDSSRELIVRTPEVNQFLDDYKMKNFCSNQSLNMQNLVSILKVSKNDLSKFAQFDIVDSIKRIFSGDKEIDSEVRSAVDFCLNMVMDIDKLDILVQRVNKRWDNWNPKYIKVSSFGDESFLDVIENVFGIPLERDAEGKIIFSERLKNILLENMESNKELKRRVTSIVDFNQEFLSPGEINQLMSLLGESFRKLTTSRKVSTDQNGNLLFDKALIININNKTKNNQSFLKELERLGITINLDLIGKPIPEELIALLEKNNISLWKTDNVVKVSYDQMRDAFPNDKERIEREQLLILPNDLREKVFMFDKERSSFGKSKFPLGKSASSNPNFFWGNVFPAIWWHLDQFIMTNMRSMESLKFISETGMLDRLKETYCSSECSKDFVSFIDEIIDYCKEFIDVALKTRVDLNGNLTFNGEGSTISMTDQDSMILIRDEACRRWHDKKKNMEIQEMMEDFSEKDLVVTSQKS